MTSLRLDGGKKRSNVAYDDFIYSWFVVGTRTFYYTPPESDEQRDAEECLALVPFADYFNHSPKGCKVSFSPACYNFTAVSNLEKGEEVFISYGSHNNDFLLVEYGFYLENNKWDEALLDLVLLTLFSDKQKEILVSENFWADFVLDTNSICYRTEVGTRLLCMLLDLWRRSL